MKKSIFRQALVVAILIVMAVGMYSATDATTATNDLGMPEGGDAIASPNCYVDPGWIKIVKTIGSESGQPHVGVTFKLYDCNGKYIRELKTNDEGVIVFGCLEPGKYKIEEIIPEDYTSSLVNKKEVTVQSNKETSVKVVNTLKPGKLKVIKTLDSESGPAGANFTFKLSGGGKVYTKTTNSSGVAEFEDLAPGKYYLEEEVPSGYVSSIVKQEINIPVNQTVQFKVVNKKVGNIEITKRMDSVDGQLKAGITFKLYHGSNLVATKVTGNDGKVRFENIPIGNYTLKEDVPSGYTSSIGEGADITVEFNKTTSLTVVNSNKTGSIEVTKRIGSSSGELKSGITFKLYQGSNLIATEVTGNDGKVKFDNLPIGSYTLKEDVPAGYTSSIGNGVDLTVEHNKTTSKTVVNTPKTGDIEVTKKIGSNSGQLQPGITFNLYKGDDLVDTKVTGNDGKVKFENLPIGSYTLKEDVPEGYTSSIGNGVDLTVEYNKTTSKTVINTPKTGSIEVTKKIGSTDGQLQSGITFKLYKGVDLVDTKVTGSNGKVKFENLPIGSYTLKEDVPAGYTSSIGNGVDLTVEYNKTTSKTVVNTPKIGSIEVTKRIGSSSGELQSGITFKLYQGNTLIDTKVTGSDGKVKFENLLVGDYTLKEDVPAGYTSSIGNGVNVTVEQDKTTPVPVINTLKTGSVEVTKRIDTNNGQLQSGITFKLYQGSNLIDTKVTGSDGKVKFENLPIGNYTLKEDVPTGYISSIGDGVNVTIEYNKTTPITVVNTQKTGMIQVTKKIGSNDGQLQPGITFKLYQGSNLIDTKVTGSDGKVKFENLPIGSYTLKEDVPAEYISSINEGVEVNVEYNKTTPITVINTMKTGSIEVTKRIGSDDGQLKPGITFKLYQGDTLIDTKTTGDNGKVKFENLPVGNYTLKEEVPAGYTTSIGDGEDITVEYNKTVPITVVNTSLKGELVVLKTIDSLNGQPQQGVEFELYKDDKLISKLSTDNFGRIQFTDLTTGTYQLKENVPHGYVSSISGTVDVEIIGGQTNTIRVVNSQKSGQITVIKKDQNGDPMKEIEFELYRKLADDETANPILATGITNDQGITIFGDLVPGDYYIHEVVPEGYKNNIDDMELVTVKPDETSQVNVVNTLITTDIEIYKTIDMIDGDPQGGVTFELYQGDELVKTGETDLSGYLIFDKLLPGEYQLKEIVPEGYESNIDGEMKILAEGDTINTVYVINSELIEIEDPDEPLGPGKFPQTGGTPATMFYIGGLALAVLGVAMRKKEDKN